MTAPRRVDLIDSCILIDLLNIPFEAEDSKGRRRELRERHNRGVSLVIPVAAVIEVGQHVQRIKDGSLRRECAAAFVKVLQGALVGNAPWDFTSVQWDAAFLATLIELPHWPDGNLIESLSVKYHEMGDAAIIAELMQLRKNLQHVEVGVWTRDAVLSATVESLV